MCDRCVRNVAMPVMPNPTVQRRGQLVCDLHLLKYVLRLPAGMEFERVEQNEDDRKHHHFRVIVSGDMVPERPVGLPNTQLPILTPMYVHDDGTPQTVRLSHIEGLDT